MNEFPAFPTTEYFDEKPIGVEYGMTLRDYFAGQALAGLLASYAGARLPEKTAAATDAYDIADAMLAERGK